MIKEYLYDFAGYNMAIFNFINSKLNIGILPKIFEILSSFFQIWCFAIYYFTIAFYLCRKTLSLKGQQQELFFQKAFYKMFKIGICYAFFGFTYAMIKFSVDIPRPFCALDYSAFTTIHDISKERCMSGFPSAHTGLALIICIYAWKYIGNIGKAILLGNVFLVAISRIVLAMHFPADIIYSIFITLTIVAISQLIYAIFYDNLIRYFYQTACKIALTKKV